MPKWTEQQRDAIADRGHSLIVCAAAGSGKTAVLVERIVQLVREGCPIENMLVVTFTNAAAGEMRQRIGEALGKAAREEPALGEQVMALSRASISTLHRFCGNLLREHFQALSIDPGFRIGDEQECGVLSHQAMEDALHAHIIAKNPTVGVTVPKASHAPKRVLTDRELDTFLDAVREDKIWGDFFYVELTTGLRRGEICGLMWQDFDARNGVLQVRRTLHNRKLGVDMLGKTKTRSGERTIVLPRSTAEILRRRKENAITQWIFPDPVRPELPLSPNCAYTHMKAILHKAGLPDIRFHDLRHTFATHAIASGVDAKTLSGILGHTNASFTLDTYTHVTPDMQKAASGIVGGFMEDLLGKGLRPWQRNGKAEPAP